LARAVGQADRNHDEQRDAGGQPADSDELTRSHEPLAVVRLQPHDLADDDHHHAADERGCAKDRQAHGEPEPRLRH